MNDFTVEDAFGAVLDRLEGAYNERLELRRERDEKDNAVRSLTRDLRNANARIDDLSAENVRLRLTRSVIGDSLPAAAPTIAGQTADAIAVTPHVRGRCAFKDHRSHRVPADLLHDQSAAQEYVAGWAEAKAEAEASPATAPADDSIPF